MNGGFNGNVNWLMAAGISFAFHAVLVVVLLSCNSAQEKKPSAPLPEQKVVETTGERPKADSSARKEWTETTPPEKTPVPQIPQQTTPERVSEKVPVKTPEKIPDKVPEQAAEEEDYVVQPGDTLSKIAKRYSCTLGDLAKLNGKSVKALSALHPGQKILVKRPNR